MNRTPLTIASRPTDGQSVTPASGRWPSVHEYHDSGRSRSMTGDSEEYELMR